MSSLPSKQKAVFIDGNSDTYEVIKYGDIETPKILSPKDIIINNKYAGVNFIEAYFRKGYYPATLPLTLGREATGVIAAVGSDVTSFKVGDKVALYAGQTFSQFTKLTDEYPYLIKLDADTSEQDLKLFGSLSVQSLTAYTFAEVPYKPKEGEYVLVWAAAGGVGQILTQILSQSGAIVIGLASSDEKLALVKQLGAKYTINYKTESVADKVKEITGGKGVKVSYDSVGQASWQTSIDSLSVGGILLSYGNSSGKVPPVSIYTLTPKNLQILRPMVNGYLQTRENYEKYFNRVVDDYRSGKVQYSAPQQYELKDYAEVAKKLESGTTVGKFVLKIDQLDE